MNTNSSLRHSLDQSATLDGLSNGQKFYFGNVLHIYVELKLGLRLDGNEAKEESKKALGYIARAADACSLTATVFQGKVFEIQGRTLHLAIPYSDSTDAVDKTLDAAAVLHGLLHTAYGSGGPDGWRMAADFGPTIAIQCPGIHGDTSIVSLSPAANRPAKKLGAKGVSVGELCYFNGTVWKTEDLTYLAAVRGRSRIEQHNVYGASASLRERVMNRAAQVTSFRSPAQVNLQAAPLNAGGNDTPTAADPMSRFGIVVSMDLDGFSASVATASTSPKLAQALAEDFYALMLEAAAFAEKHTLDFVQLPFAGDNAIFVLVAKDHESYALLKKVDSVRVAVEWEEWMGHKARASRFGGWAQVTAGGEVPHGNSTGNIHIARIVIDGRGFLVAVGPGIRNAREGFSQVSPLPEKLAMYRPDLADLHPKLRKEFRICESINGGTSSNYEVANIGDLKRELRAIEEEKVKTIANLATVSIPMGSGSMIARSYAGESCLVKDYRGKTRMRPSLERVARYKPGLRLFLTALRNEMPDMRILREKEGIVQLSGAIHHQNSTTKVVIEIDGSPLSRPPKVFCEAPWIRRNIDWHFIPPGFGHKRGHFCWVLALEWEEYFRKGDGSQCPLVMQVQDAAIWLVSAIRLMLDRHRIADQLDLVEWPTLWEQYSHGWEGVREYRTGKYCKP